MTLQYCLENLEQRIDPATEDRLMAEWKDFLEGRFTGDLFRPVRPKAMPPSFTWPNYTINQAIRDPEAMAISQLAACSDCLTGANGSPLMVRANYGVGILPSLFGASIFYMDDATGNLPTSEAIPGGSDGMRRLLDRGAPDLRTGFGGQVLDMCRYFLEIFKPYPNVRRYVHLYHPDLQGPMDVCELLWGSSLFLDIMDDPGLVKQVLDLITGTYIRFMREWDSFAPSPDGYAFHWGLAHLGHIMLRNDSAMNFSPEMFDEFINPYDERLLEQFGGGGLHFCGRGDHYIARATASGRVKAVAMSQPEYNNMEIIFQNTVDRGIPLISFQLAAAQKALAAGRSLHGCVHAG